MLYFLEGKIPLCKTFKQKKSKIEKFPYPMAAMFTSHAEQSSTIQEFYTHVDHHAQLGRCLMKGALNRDLIVERRGGATDSFEKTDWLCLDLDYVKDESEANSIIAQLGLQDVSHIRQFASGHSITKSFSAHYFFMLDQPVLPQQLKAWLQDQNFKIPQLSNQITLTRTNASLRWPMDISVADNSRIIYIAPPQCIGFTDPVPKRIELIDRPKPSFELQSKLDQIESEVIEEAKQAKINELRKAKNLKAKKLNYKTLAGVEIATNPGTSTVTGHKQERGFMYLNLNGGDSWAYYHPVDKPDILYNFKGEPNYLTKALLPEYYKAYKKAELKERQSDDEQASKHFAFLDRHTDRYYRGSYDPKRDDLELYPTDSVRKVEDFLKQNGEIVGDYIEEWDYLFRFDDERVYVPDERFVNRYCETSILKQARNVGRPKHFPPTVAKVLQSVTGGNKSTIRHFMNWLAVIIQHRQRTQTAWVFNGIQGTGKGVLIHYILKPILGDECVQIKSLAEIEEQYNAYMENCVLLMVDESKRTQIKNLEKVLGKLKQCITDPVVPIRRMRSDHYLAKNYMNVIITSNYPDPISLEQSDRRFNVGDYQANKLELDETDIKNLKSELLDFAALLYSWRADVELAKTPLQNAARRQLMYLTQSSFDITFGAIKSGDLQFFIDDLPTDDSVIVDPMAMMKKDAYINVLREAQAATDKGDIHRLTRDQVWALAEYELGEVAKTPNKFSALAKHYGITFERMRKGIKNAPCIDIKWTVPEHRIEDTIGESKLRAVK